MLYGLIAWPEQGADSDRAAAVVAAPEDGTAFDALYERYLDRVYAYLRARAATEEDAADLTQQVFLRALAALPRRRGQQETFAAWLFRIAHNAAEAYHRRRRQTIAWHRVPEGLHPRDEDDLAAGMVRDEAMARLDAVLRTLKPEAREILALHYAGRLTVAEVAAVAGKSEAAIKKQLTRTMHFLKERYRDDA
jgi:RNA polymerase sigma-70 factor (ECF subfamily)